ncbi:MAG TPA: DegT/DnrJ/EryC1/StrS family aminotransferase [Phycisphaerales bacterium]|nr:DegT/DnrJ/EryC1/StrS family aminotransferase [Phycisphaerales bacterium]
MGPDAIPLSKPDISQLEQTLVRDVLASGRLAIGPMQEEFERLVAARAGCAHGVAVSSGTAGLHILMQALGIGLGDEVVTTPLSFIASANPIVYVGARPVFADIDPRTLNLDPAKLEQAISPRTKAIIGVEAFGNPAHMDEYARIAAKYEIPLIEDSCEALGASHKGRRCGSFGRAGVFGFYPNKQITTGEGGMIVTDDSNLAAICRSLRNQGRDEFPDSASEQQRLGSWLAHGRIGFNYRMSEVAAAIGVGQMQRFDRMMEQRERIARLYIERLSGIGSLILPTIDPESTMTWFVFVVRLTTDYTAEERDRVIMGLRTHDVGSAAYFPCIHLQPPYRERFGFKPGDFPIAESVSNRTIALPFYNSLTEREIDLIAQTLEVMISRESITRG